MSTVAKKPAAAYQNVIKGKLNLKGAKPSGAANSSGVGSKRKKEETEAERIEREDRELERLLAAKKEMEAQAAAKEEEEAKLAAASTASTTYQAKHDRYNKEAADKQMEIDDLEADESLTKAERDFERAQRQRELELIRKKIAKTHRQRVEEYNTKLGNLTEHNDIPRVGPG